MRIAVVTRALPPHGGGGMERLTQDLMVAWGTTGHVVTCFTTPYESDDSKNPRTAVRVVQVDGAPGRYSARWRRGIAENVKPRDFDVIFGVSSGAASLLRRPRTRPIVLQAHGTALAEMRTKLASPSARNLAGAARNGLHLIEDLRNYAHYDGVVAVGAGVGADIAAVPSAFRPPEIRVIVNGVPTPEAAPSEGVLGATLEQSHVVFVGRLKTEKGVDLLLDAARTRPWSVTVAGSGPEAARLRQLAGPSADRVQLLGAIDRDAVGALLRRADVLVVPSRRREGLPLVVLEALVRGVRVVVTAQAAESIPPGLEGVTVARDANEHSLRVAIDTALLRPTPAPDSRFLIEKCAADYLEYFDDLVSRSRLWSGRS